MSKDTDKIRMLADLICEFAQATWDKPGYKRFHSSEVRKLAKAAKQEATGLDHFQVLMTSIVAGFEAGAFDDLFEEAASFHNDEGKQWKAA